MPHFDIKTTMTLARVLIIGLVLYTGPVQQSPAEGTGGVITILVPASLATNAPICTIG